MSVQLPAAMVSPRAVHATGSAERMCPQGALRDADPGPSVASLFPPRDADADTRAAWLARSPWPEIVFASAL